jgi:hypothetical protein
MMAPSVDDHEFNDDLLLHESDRRLAARKYPSIFHVLDDRELRKLFIEYDVPANRAKRKGLRAGFWAIGFGFGALAAAAAEILFIHSASDIHPAGGWAERAEAGVTVVSFVFGVLSFSIGSVGVLFATRKRDWLYRRLMGESVRQFHFQTLAFRLPEILTSLKDDRARAKLLSDRIDRLESFKARMVGKLDAVFTPAIDEDENSEPWRQDGMKTNGPSLSGEIKDLEPLFDAYRELRILHQLGYANCKLQDDHRIFSSMPRTQLANLSQVGFTLIIVLLILHFCVFLSALPPLPDSIRVVFHHPFFIVVIIWVALAALATRAIEQGLQPEREIERYRQYRFAVRAILEGYDEAPSQAAKAQIMREMERLVFDEMRNFLIANERSRFVM